MAFPSEDAAADSRTIYAKPFSKSTTESDVRELFGSYGSIRRVKLRREAATNSFRGSVYVEFADMASARAVVAGPPLQPLAMVGAASPPSSSGRFHVMMKADYERKRANAVGSGAGAARDVASGEGGGRSGSVSGSAHAHKRARRRSEGPSSSTQQPPPPPPPPPPPLPPPDYRTGTGEPHGGAAAGLAADAAFTQQQQRVGYPQQQLRHSPPRRDAQQQQQPEEQQQQPHLQQVLEERDASVRALEESLRKEKEDNQRLYQRLAEAQQRAQEAAAREGAANQKVLARDVEIGALKGEISMLRTQGAAQLERQAVAHKARVSELEAAMQKLKDALLERERAEREQQRRAAAGGGGAGGGGRENGTGAPRKAVTAAGAASDGAGAGDRTMLDDL